MSNAVKALLIAATVFLGILLLSALVYMFRAGASVNQQYDEGLSNNQLVLYNSKFELYNKEDNTILDLISVINLAYDVNISSNYDDGNAVEIKINLGVVNVELPNENKGLKRNEILLGDEPENIYTILEKPMNELGLNTIDGKRVLEGDKLSTTKFASDSTKTIYKYLFSCEEISYYETTGRVKSMEFNIRYNTDFE